MDLALAPVTVQILGLIATALGIGLGLLVLAVALGEIAATFIGTHMQ